LQKSKSLSKKRERRSGAVGKEDKVHHSTKLRVETKQEGIP